MNRVLICFLWWCISLCMYSQTVSFNRIAITDSTKVIGIHSVKAVKTDIIISESDSTVIIRTAGEPDIRLGMWFIASYGSDTKPAAITHYGMGVEFHCACYNIDSLEVYTAELDEFKDRELADFLYRKYKCTVGQYNIVYRRKPVRSSRGYIYTHEQIDIDYDNKVIKKYTK